MVRLSFMWLKKFEVVFTHGAPGNYEDLQYRQPLNGRDCFYMIIYSYICRRNYVMDILILPGSI